MSSNIQIQRVCEFCGNEFTARTTVTKLCSAKCRKANYKAKQILYQCAMLTKGMQFFKSGFTYLNFLTCGVSQFLEKCSDNDLELDDACGRAV